MKIFLSKEERLRYLGFDDHRAMLLGLPLLILLGNTLFSAQLQSRTDLSDVTCLVLATIFTCIFWLLGRTLIVNLRIQMPAREQHQRRTIYTLVGIILIVLFVTFAGMVQVFFLEREEALLDWQSIEFKLILSFFLMLMVGAMYESAFYFTKYRQSQLEQEKLARANMQAQLAALKQQVNPHFLFNSLNTLVSVIPENPELAVRFTQRLSAVYRRLLEYRDVNLISLEEELRALEDFVFLMQTRFEEKLSVDLICVKEGSRLKVTSDPGALAQVQCYSNSRVPPLVLQLLVENAIKHNVVSNERPLRIVILVEEDRITVSNNLQLRERPAAGTGLGHDNVRNRYRLLTLQPIEVGHGADEYWVTVPLLPPGKASAHAAA